MKVALITGASRGIGKATAEKFARNGYNLALVSRNRDSLEKVREELQETGSEILIFPADVSDFNRAQEIVKDVHDHFGRIDVLVNNAGTTLDKFLLRTSESDWDTIININLKSVFNYSKPVSKIMLKQKHGVIINVSSVVGIIGNAGQASYAASKAGILAFTKSLAKELGSRNIRVVAVAPGFIETALTEKLPEDVKKYYLDQIALKRFGKPEDVANLIYFLASDEASYISGQTFIIDGGMI